MFKEANARRHQTSTLLNSRYFTAVGSSSVKTVADRHRIAAYMNCWRAFEWYQHLRPWTTLNHQNWEF